MATKPVVMFEEQKATKFNVDLQCGDCLHYKGSAHPKFEAPCIKRGVGTKSEAPACYTPDVSAFRTMSKDVFPMLAALVGCMTPKQSRVLMGILKYAGSLEKVGLTFLEVVYFTHTTPTTAYLEDYYCGYALAMTRTGQVVLVGSDYLKSSAASMIAYLDKGSVLRANVFAKRKEALVREGKIHRLKSIKRPRPETDVDHVVPTIDEGPVAPAPKNRKGKPRKVDPDYEYKEGDYLIT